MADSLKKAVRDEWQKTVINPMCLKTLPDVCISMGCLANALACGYYLAREKLTSQNMSAELLQSHVKTFEYQVNVKKIVELHNQIKDKEPGEKPGPPLPPLTPRENPKTREDLKKICSTDYELAKNFNFKNLTVDLVTLNCDGPTYTETSNPHLRMLCGSIMPCSQNPHLPQINLILFNYAENDHIGLDFYILPKNNSDRYKQKIKNYIQHTIPSAESLQVIKQNE